MAKSELAMDTVKILLAEDHVVVRQGTRQLLENEPDLEVIDNGERY